MQAMTGTEEDGAGAAMTAEEWSEEGRGRHHLAVDPPSLGHGYGYGRETIVAELCAHERAQFALTLSPGQRTPS